MSLEEFSEVCIYLDIASYVTNNCILFVSAYNNLFELSAYLFVSQLISI